MISLVRYKKILSWSWQVWALALIIIFSTVVRFWRLDIPTTYYFDEVYHGVTAKAYARNDPAGYEWWHEAPEPDTAYEWLHPPVGKLLMAWGWKSLGQTAWAWRVPGVIFGIGIIVAIYWLTNLLFNHKTVAVLAAGLASMDGLLLSQSRIGMNDIYVTFFILTAVGSYVKSRKYLDSQKKQQSNRWLGLSGLLTGLAISTKWSGVFVLGMVGTWELCWWWTTGRRWLRRLPRLLIIFGILPLLIYILSFGQFWLQGHTVNQFKELHGQIWYYQTHLNATHSYQSKAWEWPLTIRPVWYFVKYYDNGTIANIYDLANPVLAWFGLVAVLNLFFQVSWRKKLIGSVQPATILIMFYVWSWMPWLLSPRIMFYYHYTPAIPALCMALAYQMKCLWNYSVMGKWLAQAIVLVIGATFVWLLPMWIGLPLKESWWKWLFWLPTWK